MIAADSAVEERKIHLFFIWEKEEYIVIRR